MARQMSKVTKLERQASRDLAHMQEEWKILQVELTALRDLLKSAYVQHATLPRDGLQAILQGLDRRLVKMKEVHNG